MAEKKPKRIWENCKLIGEVHKSEFTKLRIELVAKDGVKIINIREWYFKKSTKEWKPGLQGFAIPIKYIFEGKPVQWSHDLIDLMLKAIDASDDFLLHDPENEVWG